LPYHSKAEIFWQTAFRRRRMAEEQGYFQGPGPGGEGFWGDKRYFFFPNEAEMAYS
jgi:hypothetical protein